jgi:RHS repeat-associated protein
MQAQALRDTAGIEEEQAQAREAEATELLAEASEAREEATGLRTEADAFIARAQAAEALAAEYRTLAEHPPSAQIATHYLYDPAGRLLGEYDEAGQAEREYVYLEGMPLALMAPNGIYYYHTDHLGTPESLTDQDQAIVWQAHHDPFGRAGVTTQAVVNILRFPGQYFDAETGLHYNYFRDYDPATGRYIESDPIGLAGGINTYTYVGSNPLTRIDPTGEFAFVLPAIPPALAALGEAAAFVGSAALAGYALSEIVGDDAAPSDDARDDTDADEQCEPNKKDPCKGLRKQLRAHEQKLRDFIANPYTHDNRGFLANNPPSRHSKIIDGRIRELQKQIDNFRRLLEKCERRN